MVTGSNSKGTPLPPALRLCHVARRWVALWRSTRSAFGSAGRGSARDGYHTHLPRPIARVSRSSSPVRLRELKRRGRGGRWVHAHDAPLLPLQGVGGEVRIFAHVIELDRALDAVELAGIERLDQLGVVGAFALLYPLLQYLTDREGFRRVRGDVVNLDAVLGGVRLHKRLVARVVQLGEPAVGEGDPLGVLRADRLHEGRAHIRPSCEHDRLGVVVLLGEDLDEGLGVQVVRTADEHVGVLVDDRGGDRRIVGRLGGEDLIIDGLEASRFELRPYLVHLWLGERIVLGGIGDGRRTLARRHRLQHLTIAHEQVFDWDGHVVETLDAAIEDRGRATGAFDERVAITVRHDGRWLGQEAGERPDGEIDVVHRDQFVVVGSHLIRRAVVADDVELHLTPQQTAVLVHLVRPELIALLERLAVVGEVA